MGFTYLPYERQQNRYGYLLKIREVAESRGIVGASEIVNETEFQDLRMDSLDFIDFIMAIDDAFLCKIEPDVAIKFKSINDLINWVEEKDCGPFEFPDKSTFWGKQK